MREANEEEEKIDQQSVDPSFSLAQNFLQKPEIKKSNYNTMHRLETTSHILEKCNPKKDDSFEYEWD